MRLLLLAITLVLPLWAAAQQENPAAVYQFDSMSQEDRFQTLLEELRCPKCQNQNIFSSAIEYAGAKRLLGVYLLTYALIKTTM
jgi:cytochrome c-type biogenesis protein CcmH/NrfF